MKLLIWRDTNVAIIEATLIELVDNQYHCDGVIFSNCDESNCTGEVTLPPKFVGGCYTYIDCVFACVNPEQVERAFPVPTITMRQARLQLLAQELLDDVDLVMATMPKAAQIEWEYATEIRRDNVLVLALQTALSMTDSEMDLFFENAKSI